MEELMSKGERLLHSEIYKVACLKKIIVGNPLYHEEYSGNPFMLYGYIWRPKRQLALMWME